MTLEIQLVGPTGNTYDLRRGPVRLSDEGVKGFGLPDFDEQVVTSPLRDGQRYIGFKLKPRIVFIPFRFKGAAANDVHGLQRAFWRDVAIGNRVSLRVTDNLGGVRYLSLRVQDDGAKAYKFDPYDLDPESIGLTFVADQPWWQSDPTEFIYQVNTGAGRNFFGGGDPALRSAWTGAANDSTSTQSTQGVVTRTNRIADPAPLTAATWGSSGLASGVAVAESRLPSGRAYKAGFSGTAGWYIRAAQNRLFAVTAGETLTASAWGVHTWAGKNVHITIQYFDSGGASLGYFSGADVTIPANTATQVVYSGTVPSGAVSADLFWDATGGGTAQTASDFAYVGSAVAGEPGDYFDGSSSSATPFYISSASGSSATMVDNDGDTPAWPLWIIDRGTVAAFALGVDGHRIGAPLTMGSADRLVIDTDPTAQTAKLNGVLVAFKTFTDLDFAPIPKGTGTPLDIQITGSAVVTARFSRKYQRAF